MSEEPRDGMDHTGRQGREWLWCEDTCGWICGYQAIVPMSDGTFSAYVTESRGQHESFADAEAALTPGPQVFSA